MAATGAEVYCTASHLGSDEATGRRLIALC